MSSSSRTAAALRSKRPLWMVILNATPDSFSDGGRFLDPAAAVLRAEQAVAAGADILDVGGMSTRPGSEPVPPEEEARRVLPLLRALHERFGEQVLYSLDTLTPDVADEAARQGLIDLINDVAAGRVSSPGGLTTLEIAARHDLALVLMHMQGEPRTMQAHPTYRDCPAEVAAFLAERAEAARKAGVRTLLLDPGIGFGKTTAHNLELLSERGMEAVLQLGLPVLIGLSRKRFLGEIFASDQPDMSIPANRDRRSKELEHQAIARGAHVIRSHRMPNEVGP